MRVSMVVEGKQTQKISAKKGLILRSALEGIPVSQAKFKEIRGDNLQKEQSRADAS
jgi:hypothetical protein